MRFLVATRHPTRSRRAALVGALALAAAATGRSTASAAPATAPAAAPGAAGRAAADTQRVVLGVSGMSCESCERSVTVLLRHTPGVHAAQVSVVRREAVVLYDPARVTPAALAAVVGRLGYTAVVKPARPPR